MDVYLMDVYLMDVYLQCGELKQKDLVLEIHESKMAPYSLHSVLLLDGAGNQGLRGAGWVGGRGLMWWWFIRHRLPQ
jgi:hypothetical protein